MSAERWVVAAVVLAAALVLVPRFLGGRKVSSDVVRQKIEQNADTYAFLMWQLGMK